MTDSALPELAQLVEVFEGPRSVRIQVAETVQTCLEQHGSAAPARLREIASTTRRPIAKRNLRNAARMLASYPPSVLAGVHLEWLANTVDLNKLGRPTGGIDHG